MMRKSTSCRKGSKPLLLIFQMILEAQERACYVNDLSIEVWVRHPNRASVGYFAPSLCSILLYHLLTPMPDLQRLIEKATDAALTNDDWLLNLAVCDAILAEPEAGSNVAIKAILDKLNEKDANVILRTLSLLLAVGENCGSRMKQNIASRSFLQSALLLKLEDRRVHKQVKHRIAEIIFQLSTSFKKDASLKPIDDALDIVKSRFPQYLNPEKPSKHHLNAEDLQREELDMRRATELSVQDMQASSGVNEKIASNKESSIKQSVERAPSKVKKVRALYDLISYEPDELSFRKGDIIRVIEPVYRDWWKGVTMDGKSGIFPLNYVSPVAERSPHLLEDVKAREKVLLENGMLKVDRLLAILLGNPELISEEEVTNLYNETMPLRNDILKHVQDYEIKKRELQFVDEQANRQLKAYDNLVNRRTLAPNSTKANQLPYPMKYSQPRSEGR